MNLRINSNIQPTANQLETAKCIFEFNPDFKAIYIDNEGNFFTHSGIVGLNTNQKYLKIKNLQYKK